MPACGTAREPRPCDQGVVVERASNDGARLGPREASSETASTSACERLGGEDWDTLRDLARGDGHLRERHRGAEITAPARIGMQVVASAAMAIERCEAGIEGTSTRRRGHREW